MLNNNIKENFALLTRYEKLLHFLLSYQRSEEPTTEEMDNWHKINPTISLPPIARRRLPFHYLSKKTNQRKCLIQHNEANIQSDRGKFLVSSILHVLSAHPSFDSNTTIVDCNKNIASTKYNYFFNSKLQRALITKKSLSPFDTRQSLGLFCGLDLDFPPSLTN